MVSRWSVLLLSFLPFSLGCVSGRLIPLSPSEIAARDRAERARQEREANARAMREFGQRAEREVEIVDGVSPRGCRIVGFVAADVSPSDTASAVTLLKAKALQAGGNAITEVKHEVIATQIQSSSSGGTYVAPLFGGAIATNRGTTTSQVKSVEHWTAKVLMLEAPKEASASREEARASSGTGFFVSADGLLVTAHHVVENDRASLSVYFEGRAWPAELVRADRANDLAILRVALKKPVPFLTVRSEAPTIGERVYTVGFPNLSLQGSSPKLTDGIINSDAGFRDDPRHVQISAEVQPGNSGGAVVDAQGRVVGVVVSRLGDAAALAESGALPQNVNYAIKATYVAPLIGRQKSPTTPKKGDTYARAVKASVIVISTTGVGPAPAQRNDVAVSQPAPSQSPTATPIAKRVVSDGQCQPSVDCYVESRTGAEVVVRVGSRIAVRLASGEVLFGTVESARRSKMSVRNEKGEIVTLIPSQISNAWNPMSDTRMPDADATPVPVATFLAEMSGDCTIESAAGAISLRFGLETEVVLVTGMVITGRLVRYEKPKLVVMPPAGEITRVSELQIKRASQVGASAGPLTPSGKSAGTIKTQKGPVDVSTGTFVTIFLEDGSQQAGTFLAVDNGIVSLQRWNSSIQDTETFTIHEGWIVDVRR